MPVDYEIEQALGPIRAIPVLGLLADAEILPAPCVLRGWSLRSSVGLAPASAEGQVTSPGAVGGVAGPVVVGGGVFNISWQVQLLGTVSATDQDNFKLVSSGGTSLVSVNAGAVGIYPQEPFQVTSNLGVNVSIQSIAAGTVGAIYLAEFVATPAGSVGMSIELQDGNQPLGEIAVVNGEADTRLFDEPGIHVGQQIFCHIIFGVPQGVIYAQIPR